MKAHKKTRAVLDLAYIKAALGRSYDDDAALTAAAQKILDGLRPEQIRFCEKAVAEGYKIDFTYSGRFMFGARCPSIICDTPAEFGFKGARIDNMGLQFVVYMP